MRFRLGLILIVRFAIIVFGLFETMVGWLQFSHLYPSGHSQFMMTGTFYNPGPYCCFLAVICPVAYDMYLNSRYKFLKWSSCAYLVSALPVMLVLESRTGWIAASIGLLYVAVGNGKIKVKGKYLVSLLIPLGLVLLPGLYWLKPESALGRIFLWRIGLSAMLDNPVKGVGWDNVGGTLGISQEQYFSSHPGSIFETVAGSPEYAFNEFLQIGIAFGVPALLVFIGMMLFGLIASAKSQHYGNAASIVSFAIVCFSSYPFQFWENIVLLGMILTVTLFFSLRIRLGTGVFIGLLIAVMVGLLSNSVMQRRNIRSEWELQRYAYQNRIGDESEDWKSATIKYGRLPQFWFDYGQELRKEGYFKESNEALQKGLAISSDAMFLNVIGRNYQDRGECDKAIEYYERSMARLPGRLYPYYLAAKMYSDSSCGNSVRFEYYYHKAMQMKPKIMSPAIRRMRKELQEIHEDYN